MCIYPMPLYLTFRFEGAIIPYHSGEINNSLKERQSHPVKNGVTFNNRYSIFNVLMSLDTFSQL